MRRRGTRAAILRGGRARAGARRGAGPRVSDSDAARRAKSRTSRAIQASMGELLCRQQSLRPARQVPGLGLARDTVFPCAHATGALEPVLTAA